MAARRRGGAGAWRVADRHFRRSGFGGLIWTGLLLAPDLAMPGYLAGPRIGGFLHNCAHLYALPLLLTVLGVALGSTALIAAGGLWLAHVGGDCALGLGLKLSVRFRDAHLGRIGPKG